LPAVQAFVSCICSIIALAPAPATTEYITARNQAIKDLGVTNPAVIDRYKQLEKTTGMGAANAYYDAQMAPLINEDERRLRLLEPLLRRVIGHFSYRAVKGDGTMNRETLRSDEMMFGKLDGLLFTSPDGQTRILVTNRMLVNDWLNMDGGLPLHAPRDLEQVLRTEPAESLTLAWAMIDTHFDLVAKLSVSKPPQATFATVFIGVLCAEDENPVPDTLYAVLVVGEKVYLTSQSISIALPTLKKCDQQWQAGYDQDPDSAASTFNQCYASHVTSTAAYRAAVRQAQRLINDLARL
jgi:hypothetical protein